MGARALIVAALAFSCVAAAGICDDTPAQSGQPERGLRWQQQQALERGTALFILTVIVLVLMMAALFIVSIVLRRRVQALEKKQERAATELEDLWWRMGMNAPNPFDEDDSAKK